NLRLDLRAVIVVLEVDSVLVDVLEDLVGDLGQARLSIAHRRRRIAVDRAEIALPVDERHAHRPVLRHADQGVIDRGVAMRVIFTHHVRDRTGRLHVLSVPVVAALMRRIEDAAMHGLEAISHIRQRTRNDHAHGVIEIASLHLLYDGDRLDTFRQVLRLARRGLVSQWRSRSCWKTPSPYIGIGAIFPNRRADFQSQIFVARQWLTKHPGKLFMKCAAPSRQTAKTGASERIAYAGFFCQTGQNPPPKLRRQSEEYGE